jgi:hypothetical protein
MPIFPLPLGPDGPQLDVGVSVSRTYIPWGGPPGTWRALIDTGATMTAISPGVAAALQPLRLGARPIRRAGGGSTIDILIGMDLLLKIDMGWLGPRRLLFLNY